MIFKNFFRRDAEEKEDRRKAAYRDLQVKDREIDAALKQANTEPDGLSIVSRTKIVRELDSEEDLSDEDPYESLSAGDDAPELMGITQASEKSRQKVDESGVVIPSTGDDDSPPFVTTTSPTPTAAPSSGSQAALAPAPAPAVNVDARQKAPVSSSSRHVENPSLLITLAELYVQRLSIAVDESVELNNFITEYQESLASISDIEIDFLRSLPEGLGAGLAAAAIQYQSFYMDIDTQFRNAVEKGLEPFEEDDVFRPSDFIEDEDEDGDGDDLIPASNDPVPQVDDQAEESIEEPVSIDFSALVDIPESDEDIPEFDFDFSGDQASRSLSGARAASLLLKASLPLVPDAPAKTDGDKLSVSDKNTATENTVPETSAPEEIEATDAVREQERPSLTQVNVKISDDDLTPQTAESSLLSNLDLTLELLSSGKKLVEVDEILGSASTAKDPIEATVTETELQDATPLAGDDFSEETQGKQETVSSAFGFDLDEVLLSNKSSSDAVIEPALEQVALVEDDQGPDSSESLSGTDQKSFDEYSTSESFEGSKSDEDSPESENRPDNLESDENRSNQEKAMINITYSEEQGKAIFDTMEDRTLSSKEKFDRLMELERRPGFSETTSVVRSFAFKEQFTEGPANKIKNDVVMLKQDFKDVMLEKFGEIASDCEARIQELLHAPHKIEESKIEILKASAEELDQMIVNDTSNTEVHSRRLRLSSIQGNIAYIEKIAADAKKESLEERRKTSSAQRQRASEMISRMSGKKAVEVVETAEPEDNLSIELPEEPAYPSNNEELDLESAIEDSSEEIMENQFAEKPWLDPELGDLDEEYPLVPAGVDMESDEGFRIVGERRIIKKRREEAKLLRDQFLEREAAAKEEKERRESEILAKQLRLADISQREDAVRERENDLIEKIRQLENDKLELQKEADRVNDTERRLGNKVQLIDEITNVVGSDVSDRMDSLKYVTKYMQSLFQMRMPPPRFMSVEPIFMDVAVNKTIQKKVKASSVGINAVVAANADDAMPERLFPHKLAPSFHGALIYRDSRQILNQIAAELEVDIEDLDLGSDKEDNKKLYEKCNTDEEVNFIKDIITLTTNSHDDFVAMQHASEGNMADYQSTKKLESVEGMDIEALVQSNKNLKAEISETKSKLSESSEKIVSLEKQLKTVVQSIEMANLDYDLPEAIDFVREKFMANDVQINRGRPVAEAGSLTILMGIPERLTSPQNRTRVIHEFEIADRANKGIVIFSNVNPSKVTEMFSDFQTSIRVRPIKEEEILDCVRQIDEETKDEAI